jgi:L,D-transpeptidase-like protein
MGFGGQLRAWDGQLVAAGGTRSALSDAVAAATWPKRRSGARAPHAEIAGPAGATPRARRVHRLIESEGSLGEAARPGPHRHVDIDNPTAAHRRLDLAAMRHRELGRLLCTLVAVALLLGLTATSAAAWRSMRVASSPDASRRSSASPRRRPRRAASSSRRACRWQPGEPGGPFALALSARSDTLQEFEGGPGQIALHGREHLGGSLGTAVSHGCVRLSTASIDWLAARIGPGTPTTILAG